jgi:DMSO/TMAO reductase YedYZ heme-binding membrane subunit
MRLSVPPAAARLRPILLPAAAFTCLMVLALLLAWPGLQGLRMAIRATAASSLGLFLCTYLAAPLAGRFGLAGWLQHRRALGLAFAFSHGLHLLLVLGFARQDPATFMAVTTPFSRASGGLAYLLLAAMVLSSWPAPRRWLGPRAWSLLHRVGLHYLWLSFLVAYGKRIPAMPGYLWPTLLVLAAGACRLAWRKAGRPAQAGRAAAP